MSQSNGHGGDQREKPRGDRAEKPRHPERRRPYTGMHFHPQASDHSARGNVARPEPVASPEPTFSRHHPPGPFETDAIMGTYNLRKGKGHVRIGGNAADTATCVEAVFHAAGIQVPDEGTALQLMVVKHANGQQEVVQILPPDASSAKRYPFKEVQPESDWVRAIYRGFKERQGLGMFILEGLDRVVFAFHRTLEEAGILGLEPDAIVEVRHGTTAEGTPIAAEIRLRTP